MTSRSGGMYSSALRISAGDVLGRLDDGVAVVDDADADLLVGLVFGEERQVLAVIAGAFEGDDVAIELQQIGQGALVARHLPIDPLLIGIAPAGVHPDLGIDAGELAVERLGLEFELGLGAVGPGRQAMMARLLDLDHRAAGGGQFAQFGIHDVAEIEHHRPVVGVVFVPQHARQCRRADRAELDRAVAEALRDLPQCGVFERAAA